MLLNGFNAWDKGLHLTHLKLQAGDSRAFHSALPLEENSLWLNLDLQSFCWHNERFYGMEGGCLF